MLTELSSLEPLPGGWSGETFVGEVAGERCVVRVYADPGRGLRGQAAPLVDAALLHLVRGLVPVADVLEVRRADAGTDSPGLLVTSFLPGVAGDRLLPGLEPEQQSVLGRHLGALVASLGGMPMLRAGTFVDADLALAALPGPDSLPEWVRAHEAPLAGLGREVLAGLLDVAHDAESLLGTVSRRCLVHGDVNPKNVLVDPDTLTVTGLVDWEFAHAGHPFTDLGNLLRFDRGTPYVEGALAAYTDVRGGDPAAVLDLARAADLWALVDLAARHPHAPDNPVAADAFDLLQAIGRERDLHASP